MDAWKSDLLSGSPAIVDGHLLVRTKEKLYSFAAPAEAADEEGEAEASSP